MFELRPYQAEAKQAILAAWDEGYRKTLLVLPTGCGKTVVFSSVTENQVNKGHRVLIMAHRGELLDQAADKLKEASGLDSVLEKAESTSLGSFLPVTVGSVQSLAQEKRLARFPNNYFQDIIVDEAHHCLSDSYKRVLDHFPNANILGVTATPDRGDMKNLGEFFDSKAYEYSMTEAKNGDWRVTKPDTDNLQKLLKDCMTKCGFWKDDAQVVRETVEKRWSDEPTGIYIEITELEVKQDAK